MKIAESKSNFYKVLSLASVAALVFAAVLPTLTSAASLTQAGVRLGRLGTSATSGNDLLVTFKLNTTPTSVQKVKVTFPSGFTVTAGSPSTGSTFPNTPASITAPPGLPATATAATSGAGAGGSILVSALTSASLTSSTLYGFTIPTGTIQNPASAGQYNVTVESENSSGTAIDTTTTPVYIYGASANADQITVNASVAPNFSFSLSANSDTVPKVDPTTIQTSSGVNMVVSTNSPLGYTAYVKSANAQLSSAGTPGTPITNGTFDGTADTVAAGTTKYSFVPSTGAAASSFSGTMAYDGEYSVADGTHGGAFNSTNFASFVSRNGYTNADTVSLKERVAVGPTIAAANDYTDTLTVVAAGNF
jgi:hypothetical protein